ncbi:MAG: hypothetical protein QM729_21500 [Solirubrobacterales bacterium]
MEENQLPVAPAETQTQNPEGNPGIQTRIDQITAEKYEAIARAKAAEAQVTAMLAQMQSQQAQPVQPQPVVDPLAQFRDKVDPVFFDMLKAQDEASRKQLAQVMAQNAAQVAALNVHQMAAQRKLPAEVAQRAVALAQGWRMQGHGFTEQDAIRFALGEHYEKLSATAQTFAHNPGQPPAPLQGQAPTPQYRLPTNFANLSADEQERAYESSGLLDQPL